MPSRSIEHTFDLMLSLTKSAGARADVSRDCYTSVECISCFGVVCGACDLECHGIRILLCKMSICSLIRFDVLLVTSAVPAACGTLSVISPCENAYDIPS